MKVDQQLDWFYKTKYKKERAKFYKNLEPKILPPDRITCASLRRFCHINSILDEEQNGRKKLTTIIKELSDARKFEKCYLIYKILNENMIPLLKDGKKEYHPPRIRSK